MIERPLVERAIERTVADHRAEAEREIGRIVDATYRVMEREGTVEPKVRDILAEAGLATQAFYRHFASKDELLLLVLEDGRHRLAGYLGHRMTKAADPAGQVRAWVEGIVAQASDPAASARTRPFVVGFRRLAELHPDEQAASVAVLVDLLAAAIRAGTEAGAFAHGDARRLARYVYGVAISVMEEHVVNRTRPTRADTRELVDFCLRALRTL